MSIDPRWEMIFKETVQRHYLWLIGIARHKCVYYHASDIEDCVQTAIANSIEPLRCCSQSDPKQIKEYLRKQVLNSARNIQRSRQHQGLTDQNDIPDGTQTPLEILLLRHSKECIRNALEQLLPQEREIVKMRFCTSPPFTLDEIAERLGIDPRKKIYRIYANALVTLRKLLDEGGLL